MIDKEDTIFEKTDSSLALILQQMKALQSPLDGPHTKSAQSVPHQQLLAAFPHSEPTVNSMSATNESEIEAAEPLPSASHVKTEQYVTTSTTIWNLLYGLVGFSAGIGVAVMGNLSGR